MLPDEKALVQRLKDQPFALIAVNSDRPEDETLENKPFSERLEPTRRYVKSEVLDKHGITWRNAIDGNTSGPWASKWNVQGWPTLYVIDAKGVIRYKGHDGHAMEEMVDKLLAELAKPK